MDLKSSLLAVIPPNYPVFHETGLPMFPAVSVQGLSKRYARAFSSASVQALSRLDLEVAPGEIFGLLGPNGAGKTTLVKILLSVVRPTTGRAALFGLPAHTPQARRCVGYLPENHRFPDFLTARQMLELYGQMAGVPAPLRRQRMETLLETVRLTAWRDTRIKKFSKGMMQRLGLAQALVNDADLLILDEPTDGVDPLGRREIRDLIVRLRERGKTVFLNSHLLSEVEQVCTRVAILDRGRLVREGTVAELTAAERLYEVVCTPLSEDLLDALSGVLRRVSDAAPVREDGLLRYRLQAEDRTDLNAVLDRLRSAQVLIEAIRPLRLTLEESFLQTLETAPDAPAPSKAAP